MRSKAYELKEKSRMIFNGFLIFCSELFYIFTGEETRCGVTLLYFQIDPNQLTNNIVRWWPKGSIKKKKCHKKWKKSTIFLPPPPLGSFGLFWIWEKFEIRWPPPPVPNLGKIWNWENFESSESPLKNGTYT